MAAIQEPRNGIFYDWDSGSSNWKSQMDTNLRFIGTILQLSAINFTTTAPPGSPNDGDCYIIASVATGTWVGKENQFAVYDADYSNWFYVVPKTGYLCYDQTTDRLQRFNGTVWSTNGPTFV